MKTTILVLLSLSATFASHSQLTTAYTPPEILVQNILANNGLISWNHNMHGAVGNFVASNTELSNVFGFDSGIILTTGTILDNGNGPHGPNNHPGSGIDMGLPGHPFLSEIVSGTSYDASYLSFNFIPTDDTLKLEFIFGSEEYLEYVGSQFNDVAAIFVRSESGTWINIAKIQSNNSIFVNNVNTSNNSAYYVDNGDGSTAPYNNDPYYIQYDGYSIPILATLPVTPYENYEMLIIVADIGDGILDSGLFLKAGSLDAVSTQEITESSFEIVPNPAVNELKIELPIASEVTYIIMDNSGREILSGSVSSSSKIDVSELPSGNYFFVLQTEKPIVKTFQKQ
jgi:hypothetical protein